MVQVLPAVPTFGERLADTLAQAGSNIAQGLAQRHAMSQFQSLFSSPTVQTNVKPNAQQMAQNAVQQQPQQQSTMQRIANGTATVGDVILAQNYAEKISPGAGTTMAQYALQQQKLQQKEALANQQRISDITKKEQIDTAGQRQKLSEQKQEYIRARTAMQTEPVGGFDKNWLANLLGPAGEPIKTQSGVALESAMKGVLIDTLSNVSGQKNMWLEKMARSATAGIGKRVESNEALITMGLAKIELEQLRLDAKDQMRADFEAKGMTPPSNLDQLADKSIQPQAKFILDKEAYDVRRIYEKSKGTNYLNNLESVPQGTPLTLEKRDALLSKFKGDKEKVRKVALKLGYTIPNPNIVVSQTEAVGQNEQPIQ